jgi:glucose/mannose-6-phosphate isomerase
MLMGNEGLFDKRYDHSGMIDTIDSFDQQCRKAINAGEAFSFAPQQPIDKVLVCGMGGSAMAGDLALRFANIPILVNRSYNLPSFVNRNTLLVAISYSGNTAETLACLNEGIKANLQILCISSGGKMQSIAQDHALPFLKVPSGYQPRAATGYLALPLLTVLLRSKLCKTLGQWDHLFAALGTIKGKCTYSVPLESNPAKKLAQELYGHVPVIYGTVGNTDLVAMRFKTQINENAKQPAYWNAFSELNHNEILALVKSNLMPNQHIIVLKNSSDLPENRARMEIMVSLFVEHKVPYSNIVAEGKTELAQILAQIYFADYVSYYLALANQLDPTPVELIEKFKVDLAKKTS